MTKLVEAVCEEVNRLYCCIQRMNSNGCVQAWVDIKYVLHTFLQMSSNSDLIHPRYCGICHTDAHFARDPLPMPVPFPLVPGHEIAGVVTKV